MKINKSLGHMLNYMSSVAFLTVLFVNSCLAEELISEPVKEGVNHLRSVVQKMSAPEWIEGATIEYSVEYHFSPDSEVPIVQSDFILRRDGSRTLIQSSNIEEFSNSNLRVRKSLDDQLIVVADKMSQQGNKNSYSSISEQFLDSLVHYSSVVECRTDEGDPDIWHMEFRLDQPLSSGLRRMLSFESVRYSFNIKTLLLSGYTFNWSKSYDQRTLIYTLEGVDRNSAVTEFLDEYERGLFVNNQVIVPSSEWKVKDVRLRH